MCQPQAFARGGFFPWQAGGSDIGTLTEKSKFMSITLEKNLFFLYSIIEYTVQAKRAPSKAWGQAYWW